jgi:hypothetical protein
MLLPSWGCYYQSQSYVTTDSQSTILPWCRTPIWDLWLDFYYCQTVAGVLLWGCQCHLWREGGSVVYNSCCPTPAHSLGSESRRIYEHIYYFPKFESPPNMRARPLYLNPPEKDCPVISSSTGLPFRRLSRLLGLRWRCSTSLYTRLLLPKQHKLGCRNRRFSR